MIKYLSNHSEDFDDVDAPFLIAMMKLTSSVLTEIINIFLICGQNTIMDCIMNFIALGIICEIDKHYASSLRNFKLAKSLDRPPVIKFHSKSFNYSEKSIFVGLVRAFYKVAKTLYVSFYYYFFPFLSIYITFVWTNSNATLDLE